MKGREVLHNTYLKMKTSDGYFILFDIIGIIIQCIILTSHQTIRYIMLDWYWEPIIGIVSPTASLSRNYSSF